MALPDRELTFTTRLTINVGGTDVINVEGGNAAGRKRAIIVKEVIIDKKLDAPDSFRLRYGAQDMADRLDFELKIGQEVEIAMGYVKGDPPTLFKGEISYVVGTFGGGQQTVFEISGFDRSHRLTRGTRSRTWGDGLESSVKYSDVFSEVISEAKADVGGASDALSVGKADSEGASVNYVPQLNASDYHFIRALGADVDQDVDSDSANDDRKILFRKVETSGQPVLTVHYDKVSSGEGTRGQKVRFAASTVRQVAKVIVRGWDPATKKNIIGEATSPTLQFGVTAGHQLAGKAHWGGSSNGKTLVVTDHPVESKEEADAVAQAMFDQLSMDFICGDAEVLGDPAIEPGAVVAFEGYGEGFDGKYLVTECSHIYMAGVKNFTTRLSFARNGGGDALA